MRGAQGLSSSWASRAVASASSNFPSKRITSARFTRQRPGNACSDRSSQNAVARSVHSEARS